MLSPSPKLDRTEYVEQAFLFQLLGERIAKQVPMQELLEQTRHELLSTTNLPLAISFLLTELKHSGLMSPAMSRLGHYFTPFQTYLISESEKDTGRFSIGSALLVLQGDAEFRSRIGAPTRGGNDDQPARPTGYDVTDDPPAESQAAFFFQFEVLCRNRLNYDRGLTAMSGDPIYSRPFAKWILDLRAQIGLVDFADLLYLASTYYKSQLQEKGLPLDGKGPFLFGQKEGRIALANRRKDPVYLFSAMHRHLGYPEVPRPKPIDETIDLIPQMARRIERLESRIQLMEEERRASLDITKFYEKHRPEPPTLDELP